MIVIFLNVELNVVCEMRKSPPCLPYFGLATYMYTRVYAVYIL